MSDEAGQLLITILVREYPIVARFWSYHSRVEQTKVVREYKSSTNRSIPNHTICPGLLIPEMTPLKIPGHRTATGRGALRKCR
ncbi:uncharacterized protein N7500_002607 [Penicillium coprophilum]|uniref:uncharacterized protein n=1 Tax=Penicillium coprophilum TaxID=36646 RepID=UPI00238BC187|nr:uncharacterized protein N7500_002607 [Penicillium coprophilum]KAJ5169824.1 hypothetical protein N7500_002607 [Penicillium coprophilum]